MTVIGRQTLRKPYKPGRSTAVVLPAPWCKRHLTDAQPFVTVTENDDDTLTIAHALVHDAVATLPLDLHPRDPNPRP